MNMRSIWVINQSFYPDGDATGQMITDLAEDLASDGMRVTVLAGRNRKQAPKEESYRGMRIIRVNVLRLNKKVLIFRYLNYLSLFPSLIFKSFFLPAPDIIFVVSSPPFMFFAGAVLKLIKGSRLVFNVQDLYPDVAIRLGLLTNRPLISLIEKLTLRAYAFADKIICVGTVMKEKLVKSGRGDDKTAVVNNWADASLLFPLERKTNPILGREGLLDKFVVQYSGNLGMVHEIDTVLEAAKQLKQRGDIVFVFVGDGVQKNKIVDFIRQHELRNILLLPFQRREELNLSLNACDLALVTQKAGFEGLVVPSKIYGLMAVGKPIMAICPDKTEVAEIVGDGLGVVVRPGEGSRCAQAILRLAEDPGKMGAMGIRARKIFVGKYDRKLSTRQYFEILNGLLL